MEHRGGSPANARRPRSRRGWRMPRLIDRVDAFFEDHDVLALPTSQVVPFDVDLDWPRSVEGEPMETYIDWMRSCSDITVTGCPAVSMPAAFTPSGLPVGVQFVGRPRGDVELLQVRPALGAIRRHRSRLRSSIRERMCTRTSNV